MSHDNFNNQQPPPINPYSAPSSESISFNQNFIETDLLSEPRKCDARHGLVWIKHAFSTFRNNIVFLALSGLIMSAIYMLSGITGFLNIITTIVTMHFIGGFMIIFKKIDQGEEPQFSDIFAAFKTHLGPLFVLFFLVFLMAIIACIPMIIAIFMGIGMTIGLDSDPSTLATGSNFLIIALISLVSLAAFIPVMMASYLAPPLVVLHDVKPTEALKMSFNGCLKNMMPFLVLGIVMSIVGILFTVFTLGIGLLIIIPFAYLIKYNCYCDILTNDMIID